MSDSLAKKAAALESLKILAANNRARGVSEDDIAAALARAERDMTEGKGRYVDTCCGTAWIPD